MKHNRNEIPANINCDEAIKRLMDYLDNYLINQRKSELEKHLASCSSCMNRYGFQKSLKTKINSLANQQDPSLAKRLNKLLNSI